MPKRGEIWTTTQELPIQLYGDTALVLRIRPCTDDPHILGKNQWVHILSGCGKMHRTRLWWFLDAYTCVS